MLTEPIVAGILKKFDIESAIYSSVVGNDETVVERLRRSTKRCYVVDENLPLPISIGYASPATLGHDRIAGAVGALSLHDGCNVLVVDSGTAITYDVVTADRCFRGGNIAPGMNVRFAALSHHCAQLPLVSSDGEVPLIGCDTATAIRAGVVLGVVAEVTYMIQRLIEELGENLVVMLTGGGSGLIAQHLKVKNRVEINNNLVTIGLNRILNYNELL